MSEGLIGELAMKRSLHPQWLRELKEIHYLLDMAMRHYQDTGGDYWKSSENTVTVSFGNYWDRDGYDHPGSMGEPTFVEIYAYVVGPRRTHTFDSTARALAAVRQWHAAMIHWTGDGE